MIITRERIGQIIREELFRLVKEAKDSDKKPGLADAEQDSKGKESKPQTSPSGKPQAKGSQPNKSAPAQKVDAAPPNELPAEEEPADAEIEKDVEEPAVEDESDVTGGKISETVTGKTIQSISMEPKSKIVPGSKELVITFDQITDPLRVLILKTGEVKFYFRGLHNSL